VREGDIMKNLKYIAIGFVICLVAGVTVYLPTYSQKKVNLQWEHCAITYASAPVPSVERIEKFTGIAEICMFQSTGCKRDDVKIDLDYGSFLQEIGSQENLNSRQQASKRAREMAFAAAIAKLGNDGWEIVGDSIQNFDVSQSENYYIEKKSVYFKRQKQN
jgi:hypothetical protein